MLGTYPLGIMQGRLLPKYQGRYQAHPVDYWTDEFVIAKQIGLDSIEFILDFNDLDKNPLMSEIGLLEIINISKSTGVSVKSICADYFMQNPLHSNSLEKIEEAISILKKLIINSSKIGIKDIVIPLVDQSSLKQNLAKTSS